MLEEKVQNYKSEIIQKTQELIQIPSVYSKTNNPQKPFGENINTALEYMLNLGKKLGFKTKNVDGYCGYIEFGEESQEMIGIIGHLDVVPAGDGWNFPPFKGVVSDNKIFGRGAVDDKGPVISSLYAMKIIKDNYNINKRVRLILGLDEERDWRCIHYYKAHEEPPAIGFSPDADFPCIYAEKAVLSCSLSYNISNILEEKIKIIDIDCENNPLNVVPKKCSCILKIDSKQIEMEKFIQKLKTIINNFEIDIYKIDEETIKLTSYGVAAHAAHPDLGINAISRLLVVLNKIFMEYQINIPILNFFEKYINTEYTGKSLEINCEDESGILTLNVGQLFLEENVIEVAMNLRVPVKTEPETICSKIEKIAKTEGIKFSEIACNPALYISKKAYLPQTLCEIFNEETNSNLEPIAIGGATFARAFKNCISFGPNFPNDKDMCHQVDEYIEIDKMLKACFMYAKAILKWSLLE